MTPSIILQFAFATLLPVIASAGLYVLDRSRRLSERNASMWQLAVGLVFGLIAILGTELGIHTRDATMNVRDAAPIVAGLVFGAPAGIIAGIIGGVERWFAALWGRGMFTRVACSLATALAGVYAAVLRVKMFDDRKPTWPFGIAIGIVGEVLHLTLAFLTNLSEIEEAFRVVFACTGPMITANAISVGLSILVVTALSHEGLRHTGEERGIVQTIQGGMLGATAVAFVLTTALSLLLQVSLSIASTESLLTLNITDVRKEITRASDSNLLSLTKRAAAHIPAVEGTTNEQLIQIKDDLNVTELSVINKKGIITASTEEGIVGFDMASGEQSREFLILLNGGSTQLVQSYQPRTEGDDVWRKYAGVTIDGGMVQVGYDADRFQEDLEATVQAAIKNRHVGESGFLAVVNERGSLASQYKGLKNVDLADTPLAIALERNTSGKLFKTSFFGKSFYGMYGMVEGYRIVAMIPVEEADFQRAVSAVVGSFTEVMVFALLFASIYFLIKAVVVDSIRRTNERLHEITRGNLDVQVDVRSNREFASLSDDINSTVDTLKAYIDEAAARIDQELEYARSIQQSALPSVFPPYPNRTDFEIFASMRAAKEVGGDFYDFYLLDENHLAFLIADVSGKGIPAAMYMMRAKTVLKSFADTGMPVQEVLTNANNQLCEGNDANMFVTSWMGVIDVRTGHVTSANAGHNPPAILRRGMSSFELLVQRRNLILGCMEGIPYRLNEFDLAPGDVLFLYTDGVVEANDASEELYGDARMLIALNRLTDVSMEELCNGVRDDVDAFVGEAPQFDDMTMLALRYNGPKQA